MKRSISLMGLFCLCFLTVFAQDRTDLTARDKSPFASHFDVEVNGEEVVLTWVDSKDITQEIYRILRHDKEITRSNYRDAYVLADVKPGTEYFIDSPPAGEKLWYAVLTIYEGNRYATFIDWLNYYPQPIVLEEKQDPKERVAKLLALHAEEQEPIVQLEYIADKPDREVTVFRSSKVIDNPEILDYAVSIGTSKGKKGTLTDRPISGITWYYGVIDSELFNANDPEWMNFAAFSSPIKLAYRDEVITTNLRPTPLPPLRISKNYKDGTPISAISGDLPPRIPLSPEAKQTVQAFLRDKDQKERTQKEFKPHILPVDRGFSRNKRQRALKNILDRAFERKNWILARSELFALSATNGIDKQLKARILYYEGQALFFLQRYPESFASFAVASEMYYSETRPWILEIYEQLRPTS